MGSSGTSSVVVMMGRLRKEELSCVVIECQLGFALSISKSQPEPEHTRIEGDQPTHETHNTCLRQGRSNKLRVVVAPSVSPARRAPPLGRATVAGGSNVDPLSLGHKGRRRRVRC